MITEILEAPYYVKNDPRLSAPLLDKPFTDGEVGVLMHKGNGNLKKLHEKYGFIYRY